MRHVIWDWNGTLLDDLHIVVEAVNASLVRFEAGPITPDDYRDHYTRPVKHFYEALLGRVLGDGDWAWIDENFHEVYRRSLARARLRVEADEALRTVRSLGGTQSVLSMWWHSELVESVAMFEIGDFMIRVDGNRFDAGDRKKVHLHRHLEALSADGVPVGQAVMVGDSMDDAHAARDNAIACVLIDSGSHHRAELDSTGCPVADSLTTAVAMAGIGRAGGA